MGGVCDRSRAHEVALLGMSIHVPIRLCRTLRKRLVQGPLGYNDMSRHTQRQTHNDVRGVAGTTTRASVSVATSLSIPHAGDMGGGMQTGSVPLDDILLPTGTFHGTAPRCCPCLSRLCSPLPRHLANYSLAKCPLKVPSGKSGGNGKRGDVCLAQPTS